MRVGARSSLTPEPGLAASAAARSRSRAAGPSTRKRQGFVRWWFGAQRARSNSSLRISGERLVGAAGAHGRLEGCEGVGGDLGGGKLGAKIRLTGGAGKKHP